MAVFCGVCDMLGMYGSCRMESGVVAMNKSSKERTMRKLVSVAVLAGLVLTGPVFAEEDLSVQISELRAVVETVFPASQIDEFMPEDQAEAVSWLENIIDHKGRYQAARTSIERIFSVEDFDDFLHGMNPSAAINSAVTLQERLESFIKGMQSESLGEFSEQQAIDLINREVDFSTLTPRLVSFLESSQPSRQDVEFVESFSPSDIRAINRTRSGRVLVRQTAIWQVRSYEGYQMIVEQEMPVADGAVVTVELYHIYRFLYQGYQPSDLQEFMRHIQSYVRRWLRDNNMPIVVQPDGTNPVTVAMQPIIDAVNAPMMAGLEQAVLDVGGPQVNVDRSMQSKLEELKEAVWYGDKPTDTRNINAIRFLLGTQGYNEWVQAYNSQL